MKSFVRIVGLVFIIIGIVTFIYQGVTYTTRENIAQIGNIQVTAANQKTIYLPPILGGLCFIAGIVLVVFGRNGRR
jgi:hypothetical protein